MRSHRAARAARCSGALRFKGVRVAACRHEFHATPVARNRRHPHLFGFGLCGVADAPLREPLASRRQPSSPARGTQLVIERALEPWQRQPVWGQTEPSSPGFGSVKGQGQASRGVRAGALGTIWETDLLRALGTAALDGETLRPPVAGLSSSVRQWRCVVAFQ